MIYKVTLLVLCVFCSASFLKRLPAISAAEKDRSLVVNMLADDYYERIKKKDAKKLIEIPCERTGMRMLEKETFPRSSTLWRDSIWLVWVSVKKGTLPLSKADTVEIKCYGTDLGKWQQGHMLLLFDDKELFYGVKVIKFQDKQAPQE